MSILWVHYEYYGHQSTHTSSPTLKANHHWQYLSGLMNDAFHSASLLVSTFQTLGHLISQPTFYRCLLVSMMSSTQVVEPLSFSQVVFWRYSTEQLQTPAFPPFPRRVYPHLLTQKTTRIQCPWSLKHPILWFPNDSCHNFCQLWLSSLRITAVNSIFGMIVGHL